MLSMKGILFVSGSGQIALTILANPECRSRIEFSHLACNNEAAIAAAYGLGLNDHTLGTLPEVIRTFAGGYEAMGMEFGLLILTEQNPHQSDEQAIEGWNEVIDAARPMLDIADGVVLCITEREINPHDLRSPDKAYVVKSEADAVEFLLGSAVLA